MLAVCSMLYGVLFFLPDVLAVLLIEVGILLAASRYGFKVVAMGSRGLQRAEDFPTGWTTSGPPCPGSCSASCSCRASWWAGCSGSAQA